MSEPRETSFYVDPSKRSVIVPGVAADKFYSLSVRGYRRVDKDIAPSGVLYSTIAQAKSWRYRPSVAVSFNGDITGTIHGVASSQVIADLSAITSDQMLSRGEKPAVLTLVNQINASYTASRAKAVQLGGLDSQVAALDAAKLALVNYLNNLAPAWNDLTKDTGVDQTAFQTAFASMAAKQADLDAATADRASQTAKYSGITDDNGKKPQDNATVGAPAGTYVGGIKAEVLIGAVTKTDGTVINSRDLLGSVSDLQNVFGSTQSAATSATQAQTALNDAKTARDAAQAASSAAADSKTNAATAASNAGIARDQAQQAVTDAGTAKTAAQTARDTAIQKSNDSATSASNAQGFATTASGKADIATQKATDAGTYASNAQGSASTASTAAGTAQGYRDQAQTAQSSAQGSANAASASQGVAATSASNALAALSAQLPATLDARASGYTGALFGDPAAKAPLVPAPTYANGRYGTNLGNYGTAYMAFPIPPIAGRVYEVEAEWEVTSLGTGSSVGIRATVNSFTPTVEANYGAGGANSEAYVAIGTTRKVTLRVSDHADAANNILDYRSGLPDPQNVNKLIVSSLSFGAGAFSSRFLGITIRDITSQINSAGFATAASGSAQTASTKADAAGVSANAAKTSETNAGTSAGNAKTSETNASTSENNALGSKNAAAISQTVAASSAADSGGAALSGNNNPGSAPSLWTDDWSTFNPTVTDAVRLADGTGRYSLVNGRIRVTGNGQFHTGPLRPVPIVAGRRYRYRAALRSITAGDALEGLVCWFDVNGAYVTYSYFSGAALVVGQDVSMEVVFSTATNIPANAVWGRPVIIARGQSSATTEIAYCSLVDAESELSASGSASAAAGSASTASTKADAAGQSANAAKTSETNAGTSAGNALTYSNNASGSAQSALGSQQTATQQAGVAAQKASDAAGSANAASGFAQTASTKSDSASSSAQAAQGYSQTAQTQAGNAQTSASNAATSESNALGSKNAAAASASLTATTANDVAGAAVSQNRSPGAAPSLWAYNQWDTFAPTQSLSGIIGQGAATIVSNRFRNTGWSPIHVHSKNAVPVSANRRYRATARFKMLVDGGQPVEHHFYISGWDAAGNLTIGATDLGYLVNATVAQGEIVLTAIVSIGGYGSPNVSLPANTAFARAMYRSGVSGGAIEEIVEVSLVDAEAELSAAANASAANLSAQSASASKDAAGGSASAASTSAQTAQGYASNANTYAGNAQGYASNANGSAASAAGYAAQSATVVAAANGGTNPNPNGQLWDNASSPPNFWSWWSNSGGISRQVNPRAGGGWVPQLSTGGGEHGIAQWSGGYPIAFPVGWYVMEADVELVSGSWVGAGLTIQGVYNLSFSGEPDTNGTTSATQGGARRFSKLVNVTQAGLVNWHAMTQWGTFGSGGAKTLNWYRASIRPASDAEIKAQTALTDAATANAAIGVETSTRASETAALATRASNVEASVTGPQAGFINPNPSFSYYPSGTELPAGHGWWAKAGSATRIANERGAGGYIVQTAAASTSNHGFNSVIRLSTGWYVISADVELVSGSWQGSGITCMGVYNLDFSNDPDTNGVTNASTPNARKWQKLVYVSGDTGNGGFHAMVNWTDRWPGAVKTLNWYSYGIRPASSAEILAQKAIPDLQGRVSVAEGAVASLLGRTEAYWGAEVVAGSSTALIAARAQTTDPAAAPLTWGLTYNVSISNARTVTGINGVSWGSSGAWSTQNYTGDVTASALFEGGTSSMFMGIATNNGSVGPHYNYVDYSWHSSADGNMYVWAAAGGRNNFLGPYASRAACYGHVFSVQRQGTDIVWLDNGKEVYRGVGWQSASSPMWVGTVYAPSDASSYSTTAKLTNVTFGPGVPSSSSTVSIGAASISLYNPSAGGWKLAMQVAGGNAIFTGGIAAGAFIRLGTGDGWPVALKGKDFSVSDGDVVNFGVNLGGLPALDFAGNNLAALNAGETYRLYADSLTATGFTARLRISVPASPSNYDLTSASQPGNGPTWQMDKSSIPDASDGNYRLQFSGTATLYGTRNDNGQYQ